MHKEGTLRRENSKMIWEQWLEKLAVLWQLLSHSRTSDHLSIVTQPRTLEKDPPRPSTNRDNVHDPMEWIGYSKAIRPVICDRFLRSGATVASEKNHNFKLEPD